MAGNHDIENPSAQDSGHESDSVVPASQDVPGGVSVPKDESDGTSGKKEKKHLIKTTWLRRTLKILMWVVVAIVVLPFAVYIPPIQDFLVRTACSELKKSTGMDVFIDRFRLAFPLDAKLEGLVVLDEHQDTMVRARSLLADVRLRPLFDGDIVLRGVELKDGYYRMVSADSAMFMTIDAGYLKVDGGSSMNLKSQALNLINPVLKDAEVEIDMDVWKSKPDTVGEPSAMVIKSANIRLENVRYTMKMLPTIANLSALFEDAAVKDLVVDLKNSKVSVGSVASGGGDVVYTVPTPQYVAAHPAPEDTVASDSPPMVVELGKIDLKNFHVLYNTDSVRPAPGFDASYIELGDLNVAIEDFYNCSSTVRVPIQSLSGRERCGINFRSVGGTVDIDSVGIALDELHVRTDASELNLDALVTFAMMDMRSDGSVAAKGGGYVGKADVAAFMPSLESSLLLVPASSFGLDVDVAGTISSLDIKNLGVDVPGLLYLNSGGYVRNVLDMRRLKAHLDIDGALRNTASVNKYLSDSGVNVPPFAIKGSIGADAGSYSADLALKSSGGNLALAGNINLSAESYEADIEARNLNVADFMPSLGVGVVDGYLYAKGSGFDPTRPHAKAHVEADITRTDYNGYSYGPLVLEADVDKAIYDVALASSNENMDLDLNAKGSIHDGTYDVDAKADIRHLDMKAMGLMDTECAGSGYVGVCGTANPDAMLFDMDLSVRDINWVYDTIPVRLPYAADLRFLAQTDTTAVDLKASDLHAAFSSPESLTSLVDGFMAGMSSVAEAIDAYTVNAAEIHSSLPTFTLNADVGGEGVVHQLVRNSGYDFDSIAFQLRNTDILAATLGVTRLNAGGMLVDDIGVGVTQKDSRLNYAVDIKNEPPNLPEFASVKLNGYLDGNRASLAMRQRNDRGEEGYRLGLTAAYADSVLTLHFTPLNAIIGYKDWTINDDNYVEIGPGKMVRSSLIAEGMGSSIELKSGLTADNDNYLDVAIKNLYIQDFLQMLAVAPPMKGILNTDLHFELKERGVGAKGFVTLDELHYDRKRVGNIGVDVMAGSNLKNATAAKIDFSLDNQRIMSIHGFAVADSAGVGGKTKLTLDLDTFPLKIANPFIGSDMMQLQGYLNGSLALTGSLSHPVFNGDVVTKDVAVYVPMVASSIGISDGEAISIDDNLLTFNKIQLKGANDNPITLDGTVDARRLSEILFDLTMKGRDVVLINNDKRARSDIFGKLAVNVDASVTGSSRRMDIDASLSILSSTNVTYVLGSDPAAVETGNTTDIVRFVQFNDTTKVEETDSVASSMMMGVNATLAIANGATFTVYINSSGTNRAQVMPNGTLNFTRSYLGDNRLTGQLNLPSGQVRYTPPLMTEKVFDLQQNSYVSWSGNMMNPALNLMARDHMKANVQQQGSNSRLIYFDIDLSVLGTLNAPKVSFDISTDDDITVKNELLSMSADQRSNEAMNLLLYNTYTGPGVTATSNLTGNPLYSFLAGQLNSWAARAIKGVDLSFGVDQYKDTYDGQTSTATSYSYQVSKSLFDNRFKIVVGGNYTVNAQTDENFAQNLISDISFEYMLKQTNNLSMYASLFRHTGWESILEGEVTETGIGFVMKRKLDNLRSLFRFRRGRRRIAPPAETASPADSVVADSVTILAPVEVMDDKK